MPILDRLRARLPARGKLSGRTATAGLWTVAELGLSNGLRLASNLIMTRLLVPEAFGLMAMITVLHVALTLLSDIGIEQSIIRSTRGEEPRYLRAAWTIQNLRMAVMAVMVVVAAAALWWLAPHLAPVGTVYADPELPLLIAVSSVVLLLSGLESTNRALATRQMQMHWLAIYNIASQLAGLIAMVIFAQFSATVWSLLWGMIVGSAFRTLLSHWLFPGPRMGFVWDREIADELWQFGKWIIGSSAIGLIPNYADRLFLGAVLDKEHFGFYVIAALWVQAGILVVHRITAQVGLPLLSNVNRDRPEDLARILGRFGKVVGAMCVAGFVASLFLGGPLIDLLYTDRYAQAASFVPFLSIMFLNEWFAPLGVLMLSLGNSRMMAMGSLVAAIAICIALPLGYALGQVEGALLAVAISPVLGYLPLIRASATVLQASPRAHLLRLAGIILVGVAVAVFFDVLPD